MSKFFAGLEDAPQKKVNSAMTAQMNFSEESDDDKPVISNKEKKDEEILKICEETTFKKPKDIDQFFKKLTKYTAHFTKQGLPTVLVEFLIEVEKNKSTPAIFKSKKAKFLEKYNEVEVILSTVEEKKKKRNYLEEISKTYLIDNLNKRKEALLEIEKIPDLSEVEMHRINLYLISCMMEESMEENYAEIMSRFKNEKDFMQADEEKELLKTRVGKYMQRLLKYIQEEDARRLNWESTYNDMVEISEGLRSITTTPMESILEIDYFLRCDVNTSRPHLSDEFRSKPITEHEISIFKAVEEMRELPLVQAIALYRKLAEDLKSENTCLLKCAEELGHRAFMEKDFPNAMDLLEHAYNNKTLWSSEKTETMLSVLCLCFEDKMRDREFFTVFKKNLLVVGDNLLLLRSVSVKMEIARAFIFLRLGKHQEAHKIIAELLPGFQCESLLRARAIELLLTPQ
ncbi:hypothetical protein NEAUS05_1098 [Nematocida ausubeli]|nr:hypothetical protein NEAUS07_0020 [Nematocida ausubeli]KAI5147817.1 hypothetical protein NEAUS05_1098 [Nematocida ausubeli]